MLISPDTLDEVAARFAAGERYAVAPCDAAPLDLVRAAASGYSWAGFLQFPGGVAAGGVGVAARHVATGGGRFASPGVRPVEGGVAFTGFSFAADGPRNGDWAGFPGLAVVVPLVTAIRDGSGSRLVVVLPPGMDGDEVVAQLRSLKVPPPARLPESASHVLEAEPSPAEYREHVAEALDLIEAGVFEKVVLARSVAVQPVTTDEAFDLVDHLRRRAPDSYVFAWQQDDAVFLGASPELLVARRGDRVIAHPHAGSARRGTTDEEDEALAHSLMSSVKDRHEHQLVVGDLMERLRPLTSQLEAGAEPTLRRLADLQHLATRIEGTLAVDTTVLELAGVVHPTPAVGGSPRQESLTFIEKAESVDRGWYAGGIGWFDAGGNGDVAISLRCGLIRGNVARLYAGSGIVTGSDPAHELEETRWKLKALLAFATET